jgi:nucleotide-binding universal stress UspA family protein
MGPREVPMGGFERILVGWDGSPDAVRAVRVATELGGSLNADVVVLATLSRPVHAEAADEVDAEMQARHKDVLAEMAEHAGGFGGAVGASLRISHEVVEVDDPAPALCDYAIRQGCGLVVVGRHGMDQVVHPRMGRVTEQLVRHCPCPVMVVSHGDDEDHAGRASHSLRLRLRHPLAR